MKRIRYCYCGRKINRSGDICLDCFEWLEDMELIGL